MAVETDGGKFSTNFGKMNEIEDDFNSHRLSAADVIYQFDMNHSKRGMFIIINNIEFHDKRHPVRHGAEKDRENLQECFSNMGFQTKSYTNMTRRQMAKILHSASQEDHSDSDCFCCAILTHGDNSGVVQGTDGPVLLDDLFEPLKSCSSLRGKPKILIIQACRGEDVDSGVLVEADADKEASFYKIPLEADFLYAYATPPGYRAWRNTEKGSYFIHYLCDVLSQHYKTRDLMWILTHVNYRLAHEFESRGSRGEGMKQVASFVSMLTKQVVFGPTKEVSKDEY